MRFNGGVTVVALSDAELVARCRRGDEAAWAALVERFSRYVLRDRDAGLPAVGRRRRGGLPGDLRPHVHTTSTGCGTTTRCAAGSGSSRGACAWIEIRRRGRIEPTAEDPELPVVDERLARLDDALSVHDALARLQPECRDILDRFFCHDQSYATIGEALDLPAGTVASRISRCLGKLRDVYGGKKLVRNSV